MLINVKAITGARKNDQRTIGREDRFTLPFIQSFEIFAVNRAGRPSRGRRFFKEGHGR